MLDFLSSIRSVLMLVLGWLLGTLSPGILRVIERSKRRTDLIRGLRHECTELRFTLANALFSTRKSLRELDQQTLDLVKPILLSYAGTMDEDLVATSRKLFAEQPDSVIIQWANDERAQHKDQFNRPFGQYPVPYSLPLLAAHFSELHLFAIDQQEALLRVESELKLFNEQVAYVRMLTDRTFTATGDNHKLTTDNLLTARRNFGIREAVLIRSLNRALDLIA